MHRFRLPALAVYGLLAMVLLPNAVRAADAGRFSGKYVEVVERQHSDAAPIRLEVQQTQNAVEVITEAEGKRGKVVFSLDGEEKPYTTTGGLNGKCKGQRKGPDLLLETTVLTSAKPFAPPVPVHTRERWSLSNDGRTLTIIRESDFPSSATEPDFVSGTYVSGTHRYSRVVEQ